MGFFKSFLNVWYYQWTLPAKLISVAVLVVLLLIVVFGIKSCGKREPKLNEPETQRGEAAVKSRNDAELTNVLAESDVRTEKALDTANKADAETKAAIQEAKQKYEDWTPEQKAAEFERRKNQ